MKVVRVQQRPVDKHGLAHYFLESFPALPSADVKQLACVNWDEAPDLDLTEVEPAFIHYVYIYSAHLT
jgi:hypothetical protein